MIASRPPRARAEIAAGMKRYGFHEGVNKIAAAIFAAAGSSRGQQLDTGLVIGPWDFGLDEVQKWIVEQLLLEVLLEVEQGHVEQIHRLIQAWIDLQLLAELG